MSSFLILFLIAISGIIFLVARKLILLQKAEVVLPPQFDFAIELPDFEEIKQVLAVKSRRYGYVLLVIIIRFYVLSQDIIKTNTKYLIQKIHSKLAKKSEISKSLPKENKFLKKIAEYKKRIHQIKEKIKKEEGLN